MNKWWCIGLSLAFSCNVSGAFAQRDSISSQPLKEVIVTGSNRAVSSNLLPYSVSIISDSQIQATGDVQLLSAVSGMVPSLFVTQRNIFGFGVSTGGAGHIKLRGIGGDRASAVLMMVDGQPQFAGLYSHHVADTYSSQNVDHVEVLRGPASVLYGSNAMAGVINIITKNPQKSGVYTSISSQYGSHNTWLSTISNSVCYGNFSSLASAEYNRTDGLRENFDCNIASAYAKVAYKINQYWDIKADYAFSTFSGNDPVYPTLKGDEGVYHQRVIRGESSVTVANNYAKSTGVGRIYYSYGNHFIHDPNYFHSLDDRFGIILYQNISPWRDADATIGFDFDSYSGKIPYSGGKNHEQNPMATMERRHITEYSPYITISQKFWQQRIVINAGLRMANSNLFATNWVPQAGFVLSPYKLWSLKASVAKGYRNPSFRELYLYKFANPDLKPEEMINYELSVSNHFNRYFSCSITGYIARGSNLIQQSATLNENTGSFLNKGIEVSAQSFPLDNLSIRASYSYLHTSLSNLTGAPKNLYFFSLMYSPVSKLQLDADVKGVGGLFVDKDIVNQNYITLDLHASYQVIKQLNLFVNFDNITNSHYIINKGYPMPGFTLMGGFKLSL